jgi:ubiquinone/menaquinone biosynthesis C-methylase UbiE
MSFARDMGLWALGARARESVAALYGLLGTRAFTREGMWLNLGDWREATTIEEACPALALRLAEHAGMGAADEVVDVGFGFASQDILWAQRFAPRRITGLNVTPQHVRMGRVRVRRAGLSDVITLREGSATAMPLPDACCDVVTALECAFHFDTRERFLAEAWRVLRPGGRLVMADILRAPAAASPLLARWQALSWRGFADRFQVPAANAVERAGLAAQLAALGFEAVRVEPIGEDVFPGFHHALMTDRELARRLPATLLLPYRALGRLGAARVYAALDYVLVFAQKPH